MSRKRTRKHPGYKLAPDPNSNWGRVARARVAIQDITPRYGINPPGSTVKYDPGAIFPKDLFPPNPREEAITELTAIARRMSQANLDQLVGIAKDIQTLHPAKKEETDEFGASIGTGYFRKVIQAVPVFQFGLSGFKDAMSVQSEMDRIQSLTQEIMSVPLPNILPEEKS